LSVFRKEFLCVYVFSFGRNIQNNELHHVTSGVAVCGSSGKESTILWRVRGCFFAQRK